MGVGRETEEKGDLMYTNGRFTLLYGGNQHNTVKQLSSSLKKIKSHSLFTLP